MTAPPDQLTVRSTLDWDAFAERHWDRGPVLYEGVTPQPFVAGEVFEAAALACRPQPGGALPPGVQVTVDRRQQVDPGDHLPAASDGSLDGYHERVTGLLAGRRYALIVNGFHGFHHPQWRRERDFYAGLWRRVGQPLSGAITTMFHGTYEHSPVGVHKDRFATFMFCLSGRKRMRFWASRPWTEAVTTILDYQPYLDESFAVDVSPGDLLYWPADYFHVGESLGGEVATSVNVGVPREGHRAAYDLDDLLVDLDPATLASPESRVLALPDVPSSLTHADAGDLLTLPPALTEALAAVRGYAVEDVLAARTVERSLEHWTSGGLRPVPPLAPGRPLPADVAVRATADVCTALDGGRVWYAANGHAAVTALPARTADAVVGRLRAGGVVRAADHADGERAEVGRLLETLVRMHAAEAVGAG